MNLQFLFAVPVLRQQQVPDVHVGQASDVWLVDTADSAVVVRRPRIHGGVLTGPFWMGCQALFGTRPGSVSALGATHRLLSALATLPIPRVLDVRCAEAGPFVVVERMPGQTLLCFADLDTRSLRWLGEAMACWHSFSSPWYGALSAPSGQPAQQFHPHAAAVIRQLADALGGERDAARPWIQRALAALRELPALSEMQLIMLDLDPTQFLHQDGALTALVDAELFALGPSALELAALEYLLDGPAADAFRDGYERVLPLPDLSPVRLPYRCLLRLLEVQGRVDWNTWMTHPTRF
ncbi:hypothetical protein GCM10025857_24460 [Alicyclobacillus contaminans]|uniref:phosphotransferase n=1 Tax=Alicyclobacillus contaminans TaxID=392016 RepID=UPI0003F57587|nr:phosphotransferase [Alicyclobacillus contaminans]GMA51089.1 hypothetical protein GCM10025857_24460 [Alicyclobacillus contaminans]